VLGTEESATNEIAAKIMANGGQVLAGLLHRHQRQYLCIFEVDDKEGF